MILLELILVIVTWRRGWRWWSLLPWACAYVLAFSIGFAMGAAGVRGQEAYLVLGGVLEIFLIIALIVMAVIGRKKNLPPPQEKETE